MLLAHGIIVDAAGVKAKSVESLSVLSVHMHVKRIFNTNVHSPLMRTCVL